jgi:hypothetical protein
MAIGKSKENTESSVSSSRGKVRDMINILHVTTSDKTILVFDNGSKTATLNLVLSRASKDVHGRNKRNRVPIAFESEGG